MTFRKICYLYTVARGQGKRTSVRGSYKPARILPENFSNYSVTKVVRRLFERDPTRKRIVLKQPAAAQSPGREAAAPAYVYRACRVLRLLLDLGLIETGSYTGA